MDKVQTSWAASSTYACRDGCIDMVAVVVSCSHNHGQTCKNTVAGRSKQLQYTRLHVNEANQSS